MAIWPFGRRRDADTAPEPAVAESASPSTGEADVARPERQPTGDWMTLPPVRTTAAPTMPPTFRVQRLPEILTSHQDTRLSGSLGHAVSPDAPSGTIGGLAEAAGSVSHFEGRGTPELREPHHAPTPAEPVAPLVQRRLDTTVGPAPVTTSGASSPALPAPEVSRVLANPAPAAPPAAGEAPLPIARVVDAPASASAPAPAPSAAPEPAAPAPDAAPLTGDTRVGGFEAPLEEMLAASDGSSSDLLRAPAGELAPPIQPRRVQRQAAPGAPTAPPAAPTPAAPSTTGTADGPGDAPSVQTLRDGTTSPATPATPAPETSAATPTTPLVGDSPAPVSPPLTSSAGAVASEGGRSPADLPLVEPASTTSGPEAPALPISRLADAPTASNPPSTSADLAAPATGASTDPTSATGGSTADGESTSAAANESTSAAAGESTPAAAGESTPAAAGPTEAPPAPLVGDEPLTPAATLGDDGPTSTPRAGSTPALDLALPLQRKAVVESASTTGTTAGGPAATSAAASAPPSTPASTPASTIQRDAATTSSPAAPSTSTPAASAPPAAPSPSAPLVGGAPDLLATTGAEAPALGETTTAGPGGELPLVEPVTVARTANVDVPAPPSTTAPGAPGATAETDDEATTDGLAPALDDAPVAPTLGHGGDGLGVQRLADRGLGSQHADATSGGTSSLPLAPALDAGASLQPPTPSAGGTSASASRTLPVASTSSPAATTSSPAPAVQRRTDSSLPGPATGALAAARPLVRPLTGAAASPAAAVADAGISTLGLQRVAAPGGATASAATSESSPAAVEPVLVRRLAGNDGLPSGVVTPESLAPLQRTASTAATAATAPATGGAPSAGGASVSSLPLHTPAAAVPSAADVAVKAGFAERGPNGDLFYTSPPGGAAPSVQRALMTDPTPAPSRTDSLAIAPAEDPDPATTANAAGPQRGPESLAKQAKALYPYIRKAMERDLRRDLEAKNRAGRFRP